MTKRVTFYLGPANSLNARRLTITRHMRAGDDSAPSAEYDTVSGGSTEFVSVVLPNNVVWQAKLLDTRSSGEQSEPQLINFQTGDLQFPGPRCSDERSSFRILSMEDISSSSSSSSVSSSSVSSSSSSSVSSSSSQSSSSSSSASSSSSSSSSSQSA